MRYSLDVIALQLYCVSCVVFRDRKMQGLVGPHSTVGYTLLCLEPIHHPAQVFDMLHSTAKCNLREAKLFTGHHNNCLVSQLAVYR